MKITVVATSANGWHANQLIKASQKAGVELEFINIESINYIKPELSKFGDVVFWRSASISPSIDRTILLSLIEQDIPFINRAIVTQPFLAYKLYQQKIIEGRGIIKGIPTFKFKNKQEVLDAVKNGILKYPFIQKPSLGSKGNGVTLIKTEEEFLSQPEELEIKDQVYQNFIKNDSDFRVLMLGGRVLGVMKRVAREGSFLNNVSKGGRPEKVTNEEIISQVSRIAEIATSTFRLTFCGVDVIKNEETGEYHFLEVNTVPQWEGFQSQFPDINVADEIIGLCIDLAKRRTGLNFKLARDYYDKNYVYLDRKKFHYASRMYLWTKEETYRHWLDDIRQKYVGLNLAETKSIIKERLSDKESKTENRKKLKQLIREPHLQKYPMLPKYNSVLFLNLFAETLYGVNIRTGIKEFVTDEEFLKLYNELKEDKESISVLSTHAINYFYLLQNYFGNSVPIVEPQKYLNITKEKTSLDLATELKFKIYLLTHCIIGKSRFYAEKVQESIYVEMCKIIEQIIKENYFLISLDNKVEFLVCCKLCNYKSSIEEIIQNEAQNSFADAGNFIVDKMNLQAKMSSHSFTISEHRNVLYIMSNLEYKS